MAAQSRIIFSLASRIIFSLAFGVILAALPLAAQNPTEQQYITSVDNAIGNEVQSLGSYTPQPFIVGGNLVFANGGLIGSMSTDVLVAYVDGLKASGVQRVELNPGTTSMNDMITVQKYDAIVQRVRQLGMRLAINPEFTKGELTVSSFSDFQNVAVQTYAMLAARYQPDNFVIVHEPDTMSARMGLLPASVTDWDNFVNTMAPLIKQASPHTRVGAGCFYNSALPNFINNSESAFFGDFIDNQQLDFLTMDIYSADFDQFTAWAMAAQAAHKGIYIEEVWAPHDLPNPLPSNWGSAGSLDAISLIGATDADFATMDQIWLNGMGQYASALGLEAMTAFTTETFFAYGSPPHDHTADATYMKAVAQALLAGSPTTPTAMGYAADAAQFGIPQVTSVNSASYATLPSLFNPNCGTNAADPCYANQTVAPGSLESAFGADLANTTAGDGTFPVTLGGTTMTLVDATNTSFAVQLYFVSPNQVNYLVPPGAQPGPATITANSGDGTVTTGIVFIAPVMPGIYTANANGQGVASAIAICAGTCTGWPNSIGNGQFYQSVYACNTGSGCTTQPLSFSSTDTIVIELFGTGIRGAATSAVTATTGNQNLPVLYAGTQGQYLGLDQVNVQIPPGLAGAGQVELALTVAGVAANPVTLEFQ